MKNKESKAERKAEKQKWKEYRKRANAQQMMTSNYRTLEQENKRQAWRPFLYMIRNVKFPWLLIALCTVVTLTQGTLTLLFPQYTEQIYAGNFSVSIAVTATLVILGQAILTAVYQFIAGYTSHLNQMRMQNFIWRRLSRLPLSYYEENEPRDLISRTTDDTTTLSEFFSYGIASIFSVIYTFIGSFVLIVGYHWKLALSMVICIPLCYAVGIIAGRVYYKMNSRIQGKLSDLTRYFSAILPYLTLTKLFGQEKREEANGAWWIDKYFETGMKNSVASLIISFASTVTSVLQELVIILMGVWMIQAGEIDVSVWIAFYLYANTLNSSFSSIMSLWQSLKQNQGACARLSDATSQLPEENPGTMVAAEANGDLSFQNVTFSYKDEPVLKDVSFTAPEGQLTALVGPSGAGKSTTLSLIERFYAPKAGSVTLGGVESTEYELYGWRKNIGYIPQDCQIFSGTIRDNIAYGVDGGVSDDAIRAAAAEADALGFIESFPQGLDTEVGENGANLSGGQRQRIAIARALLMDAHIFILDEITSNLDAQAESQIVSTLENLRQHHTVIMVAHNMDSVRDADQILVMDQGSIVASGNHDTLMKSCSLYQQMVDLQFAGIAI